MIKVIPDDDNDQALAMMTVSMMKITMRVIAFVMMMMVMMMMMNAHHGEHDNSFVHSDDTGIMMVDGQCDAGDTDDDNDNALMMMLIQIH